MVKFHINNKDEVKKCSAKISCRFGTDNPHFSTKEEAEYYLDKKFTNKSFQRLTKKENKPDVLSAETSKNYAHLSIAFDHMHNGTDPGNDLELYYYNSPAGRLELERRRKSYDYKDELYETIQETIDKPNFKPIEINYDKQVLQTLIQEGKNNITYDFSQNNEILSATGIVNNEHNDSVRHAIVEESSKWYKNLTTEQQESLSELTSNGFQKLQYAHGIKIDYPNNIFDNQVDIDYYYEKYDNPEKELHKEFTKVSQKYSQAINESFKHAPKLEKPIITYRGTTEQEIKELLRINDPKNEITTEQIIQNLENKEFQETIDPNSRLSQFPVSTSVSPDIAKRFGDRKTFLEIKRTTSTSPVINSAWGSAEQEFLTNPHSEYKIVGYREIEKRGKKGIVLQIEEIN